MYYICENCTWDSIENKNSRYLKCPKCGCDVIKVNDVYKVDGATIQKVRPKREK
jgi:hypothetical protein